MELTSLKFVVDTSELVKAKSAVEALGTAVSKLNKPVTDNAKATAIAAKEQAKAEEAAAKAAVAVAKLEAAQNKATASSKTQVTTLEKQNMVLEFMTQGYSRGQASMLATAKSAGALTDEISQLGKVLQTQRTLMGTDPFDKSIGAMQSLKNEYTAMKEVQRLYNAGLGLSKTQMEDLAREKLRLIEKFKIEGKSLTDIKNGLMDLNSAYIANANAENAIIAKIKEKQKAQNDAAKSQEYISREMERVNALTSENGNITSATNNKLIAMKNAFAAVGMSAEQQAIALEDYKKKLLSLQKIAGNKQVDYLSRALGPQITDIAVGLATGQAPLTVMLQQGGQLRDQFALAGVAGKDMGKMLEASAKNMVSSIKDVTIAVGGLIASVLSRPFLLPFDRLKEVNAITAKLNGGAISQVRANRLIEVANGRLIQSYMTVGAVGAAAIGVTLIMAIKEVIEQERELNKAVNLTGAAMGMTQNSALTLANKLGAAKGNVGSYVTALTEISKAGGVASKDLEIVAKTIVDVNKVTGISATELAKNFNKLYDKPTETLIGYAKELGTIEVNLLRQVHAYELAGNKAAAASLATDAYSKSLKESADRIKQDMGYLEKFFYGIGDAAKWMWDKILNIGRKGTLDDQLDSAIAKMKELQAAGGTNTGRKDRMIEAQAKVIEGILKEIEADKELGKQKAKNADDAAKFEKQIKDAKAATLKIPEDITLKDIQKQYQDNTKILDSESKKLLALNKERYASGLSSLEEYTNEELRIVNEQNAKKLLANDKYIFDLEKARDKQIAAIREAYGAASSHARTSEDANALNKQLADTIESVTANYDRMTESVKANNEVIANKLIEDRIKAMEKLREEQKKFVDSLTDVVTTSLFEGGKAGAKKLRNLIIAELKKPITVVVQAVVGSIVQSATNSLVSSVGSGAVGSSVGSALGNAAMNASGLGSVFASNAAYGAAIGTTNVGAGSQAAMLAEQTGGFGAQGAYSTSQAAAGAGSGAYYYGSIAAGALGGMYLNRKLSGGYEISSGVSTLQDIGTAVASYLLPGVGGLIAGVGSALMNRAFGMGAKEVTASGIRGTYSAGGSSLQSYQNWTQEGGWFRSDKSGTEISAVSSELTTVVNFALSATAEITKNYARLIGATTEGIDSFSKSVDISLKGLSSADAQKAIADSITAFGEDLAQLIVGPVKTAGVDLITGLTISLNPLIKNGETATQALTRLSTSLVTVNGVLDVLNQTLLAGTISGADAASKLADAFGGLDNLTAATTAYYQAFYTEEERNAKTIEQLKLAFTNLGFILPTTLQGFRDLVDIQNLNTESGRNTYAALLGLSSAFATVTNAAEEAAKASREAAAAIAKSISDWLKNLVGGIVSPQSMTYATKAAYTSNLALARTGDSSALNSITSTADAYLASVKATATSTSQYKVAVAQVAAQVASLPLVKSYNDQVLEKLGLISNYTDDTAGNTSVTIDELISLQTNGLNSVYKAIAGSYEFYDGMNLNLREIGKTLEAIATKSGAYSVAANGNGFFGNIGKIADSILGGVGGAIGSIGGAIGDIFGWADGGVFGGNGVYTEPTPFMTANGTMNVMGEAGPEAVMPLERMADGSLGVRAIMPISNNGNDTSVLWQAIEKLNTNLDGLRAETRANVINTSKTAKLLDRVVEADTLKVQTITV